MFTKRGSRYDSCFLPGRKVFFFALLIGLAGKVINGGLMEQRRNVPVREKRKHRKPVIQHDLSRIYFLLVSILPRRLRRSIWPCTQSRER